MIAVIDNYDSFTYNLVQLIGELGGDIEVFRNDAVTPGELEAYHPSHIVISPGPGVPSDAGVSEEVIRCLGPSIPILGVCLGHQAIGAAFGGQVVRAPRLMHGKTSPIYHNGTGIFSGLPNPFEATATTQEGELMGLRHRRYPIHGVQFHPESILTPEGKHLIYNFLQRNYA